MCVVGGWECNVLFINSEAPAEDAAPSGSERKLLKDGDRVTTAAAVDCDERSRKNGSIYRRGLIRGNGLCMTQQPML